MPNLGAPEIIILILVVLLLFGGRKLPELARGSGRALRIFKSEVRASEDEDKQADVARREIDTAEFPPPAVEPTKVERRDDTPA